MALVLGKTVAELRRSMSPRELEYWMAYFKIEPFGPLQESRRFGMLAATVANTTPGIKRHYEAADFFSELEVPTTDDEFEDPEDAAIAARDQRFFDQVMANIRQRKAAEAKHGH